MPQLGETVTEGTITKWYKRVGETIAEDEVLFEVSTDKVDSEVPSPVSGTVTEILVQEGQTVSVGAKLAVIGAPADRETAVAEAAELEPAVMGPEGAVGAVAGEEEGDEDGRRGQVAQAPAKPPTGSPGKLLSPVVRRLISEHGLDPAAIPGSGLGGRITRDDVLAAVDRQGANGSGAAGPTPSEPTAPAVRAAAVPAGPVPVAGEGDTVVPFTNIRRRTAEHMVRSKATSAHTMIAVEIDYSAVDRARLADKDRFKAAEGFSLTYLPFIARAVVDALTEWPYLNSSVGDDELIVHGDVNLGIAVDLDFEGLLVPVVHRAEEKRLVALAREISSLASRARSKHLTMDDIAGGTFTLTNAGGFGTFITVPVINQPQVAILSTDGVRKRPVAVEMPDGSDGIAIHPVGNLVMSWDHRAVDGAYAAAFMAKLRDVLQTRDWAGEL
jgi:2-oxoglutarate dehydrogenase E2 component (dihydrolipoamide succinyltransferase)